MKHDAVGLRRRLERIDWTLIAKQLNRPSSQVLVVIAKKLNQTLRAQHIADVHRPKCSQFLGGRGGMVQLLLEQWLYDGLIEFSGGCSSVKQDSRLPDIPIVRMLLEFHQLHVGKRPQVRCGRALGSFGHYAIDTTRIRGRLTAFPQTSVSCQSRM